LREREFEREKNVDNKFAFEESIITRNIDMLRNKWSYRKKDFAKLMQLFLTWFVLLESERCKAGLQKSLF
jgi:hypothetical protein